jgi:hypothetical protein
MLSTFVQLEYEVPCLPTVLSVKQGDSAWCLSFVGEGPPCAWVPYSLAGLGRFRHQLTARLLGRFAVSGPSVANPVGLC